MNIMKKNHQETFWKITTVILTIALLTTIITQEYNNRNTTIGELTIPDSYMKSLKDIAVEKNYNMAAVCNLQENKCVKFQIR
jgi:YbbR domain-containing protein